MTHENETTNLETVVEAERARVARLEAELRQLRAELHGTRGETPAVVGNEKRHISRAGLLTAAGLAGAAALFQPVRALADTPPPIPSLTLFPNPRRVFGQAMTAGQTSPAINATTSNGTSSGVPVGASAAWAAVQADHAGVLTLFPAGTADPGIANWAVSGTGFNLLYMLVPLSSAGTFQIHSYLTGNVYVDAWGYLY